MRLDRGGVARRIRGTIATVVVATIAWYGTAAAAMVDGTFALQTGTSQTTARLDAIRTADPLVDDLAFRMFPRGADAPVTHYDVDMTKLLHVIIVSDDFATFMHVHPVLGSDGRFRIEQRFPRPALYHVYADGEPHGYGQQVFRFDVPVGIVPALPTVRDVRPTGPTVVTDGYTVTLSSTDLRAGSETRLGVRVLKYGKLATDMQTYLGAAAHAVFLNAHDLTYVHVHPVPAGSRDDMKMSTGMSMSGMSMGSMSSAASPEMTLHVGVEEPGTYAFWLQFRAGGGLHVARFVVRAR